MRARSACTRARAQLPPLWITKKYRLHCTYTVGIPSYDVRGEEIPQKEANGTTETRGETHATRQIEGFCQGLRARLRVRPTRWQQRPRLLAYAYGTSRVGVAYKCIAARSSGCRAAGGLLQHRRLRRLRLRSVPHAFTRGLSREGVRSGMCASSLAPPSPPVRSGLLACAS